MKIININILIIWTLLAGNSTISAAQDTLTVGEIYSFSVGDEFHYFTRHADYTSTTEGWIIKKVIAVNTDSSSIIYTFQTIDSNRLIDTQFVEIPAHTTDWTIVDSIQKKSSDITMGQVRDTTFAGLDADYLSYSWGVFDGTGYDCIYAIGLGRTKHHASWLTGDWQVRLVYYKKGSEEWGTPLNVKNLEMPSLQCYPNPTQGRLFVVPRGDQIAAIKLFDAQGRLVRELDPSENEYDLSRLSPGLYYLSLQSGENTFRTSIIIR